MSSFRDRYTKGTSVLESVNKGRIIRAKKHEESRKKQRMEAFNNSRHLVISASSSEDNKGVQSESAVKKGCLNRLYKWEAECKKHKQFEKNKRKTPFVVGVVHHKLYSPAAYEIPVVPNKISVNIPKRITKVTRERLKVKALTQKADTENIKRTTKDSSVNRMQNTNKKQNNGKKSSNQELSSAPGSYRFKATRLSPKYLHGKNLMVHKGKGEDTSLKHKSNKKDNIIKQLDVTFEQEKHDIQYFKSLLNRETARLNKLCEQWTKIKESAKTLNGRYEINQAVGQTILLISNKFERFRRLIANCESGKGKMLVTREDLEGFWDMMYMEVKDCDLRFEKLNKLYLQGWKEKKSPIGKPIINKKDAAIMKVIPKNTSSIKTFIAERKKSMASMNDNNNSNAKKVKPNSNLDQISSNKCERTENANGIDKEESMFIGPIEKKLTPMKQSKKISVLHQMHLSRIIKKRGTLLSMIKISRMYKMLDIKLNKLILSQAPNKDILKQVGKTKLPVKVKYKNNVFDHVVSSKATVNKEIPVKKNLDVALSRIESTDFNYAGEVSICVRKRLIFDDNICDEGDIGIKKPSVTETPNKKMCSKIPFIHVQAATPLQQSQKKVRKR